MASALSPDTELVTVKLDATRAEAARTILAPVPNVRVLHGDCQELLPLGPFSMLFADGGAGKQREPETVLEALRLGGPRSGADGPTLSASSGSTSRGWQRRRS